MRSVRWAYGLAMGMLFAGLAAPATAQVAPLTCQANAGVAPTVGVEGYTELLGDFLVVCTGGTPTASGSAVPAVDITLSLNTNLTSQELAVAPGGVRFNEALLLVDEPSSQLNPGTVILNCGQTGAPDTGLSGLGVCSIVSTGNPVQTYGGTTGHPNVFQGRVGTTVSPAQLNAVTFLNVPFDPPGDGIRTLRITNLRANAALLGVSTGESLTQVIANVSVSGSTVPIGNPQQTVAYVVAGMLSSVTGAGTTTPSITLSEGFSYAFKAKNVSFAVGDNDGTPGNATYNTGLSQWVYNSGTYYPADDAQNVPGVIYFSETGFEWLNNTTNAPPLVNPPPGYGTAPVPNVGDPLASAHTGIANAGSANAGMRVAIQFQNIARGATVTVPEVVYLYQQGCTVSCTPTGVMVLTNAHPFGGGAFSASSATTLNALNNAAVYEVLYAQPFSLEYATVNATVSSSGAAGPITETVSFAPFYSNTLAGEPSLVLPVPRFVTTP